MSNELIVIEAQEADFHPQIMQLIPIESFHEEHQPMEVCDESINAAPLEVEIVLENIPGAGNPEPIIEVQDEVKEELPKDDENDAKSKGKWSWSIKDPTEFVKWIASMLALPSTQDRILLGLRGHVHTLSASDSEISKAMRSDLEGTLDATKVEEIRSKIDDGLSRLHDRLDKVNKTSKKYKKKKKADVDGEELIVKEAQKITGVQGIFVTVPLLISRIARTCINGMVSGGHDLERVYKDQCKLYSLNVRECAEVRQLLFDMGYAVKEDRGYLPEDQLEVSDTDGMDFAQNFRG